MNTLPHIEYKKTTQFRQVPLDCGVTKEQLEVYDLKKEGKDCTILKMSENSTVKNKKLKSVIKKEQLFTPESRRDSKRMILKGKSQSSKSNIQKQRSSKTLVARSTTNARVSKNSWTKLIKDVSTSWSSCTKTDSVDLRTTCSNTHSRNKELRSKWFQTKIQKLPTKSVLNKKWQKISSVLSTTLSRSIPTARQKTTVKEQQKTTKPQKPEINSVLHYRFYPTDEQKVIYDKAFGTRRFIRNHVTKYIERYTEKASRYRKDSTINPKADPTDQTDVDLVFKFCNKSQKDELCFIPGLTYLSQKFINNGSSLIKDNEWLADYTNDFRSGVIRDLLKDYKTAFARYKNDKKPFRMSMKSRKHEKESGASFHIYPKHWNSGWWIRFLPKDLRCRDSRSRNLLPQIIKYGARVKRTSSGAYYFIIPSSVSKRKSKENLLVIDPGYRTCFTSIDFKNNELKEIGTGISYQISRMTRHLNQLRSKRYKKKGRKYSYNHRQRCHFKKACTRLSGRISNMIDDLHKSVAKHMCRNYSIILVPKLDYHNLKRMTKRQKSMAARVAHCKFVDRLIAKSSQYENCQVILVDESYTSKTCSRCGFLHERLGASKIFNCLGCKVIIDRDVNAVYNILMKTVAKHEPELFLSNGAGAYPLA